MLPYPFKKKVVCGDMSWPKQALGQKSRVNFQSFWCTFSARACALGSHIKVGSNQSLLQMRCFFSKNELKFGVLSRESKNSMKMERRFFVVVQYLLDVALHSTIIFGWATMRLIFDLEFPDFPAKSSALIFTLSLSLTGLWLIFVGWIRDSISFGWSRIGTGIFLLFFG